MESNGSLDIETRRKWRTWIEDVLQQVSDLAFYRYVFREVQAIVAGNKAIHQPSYFYPFLLHGYRTYMVAGIRRQLKVNQQSISLARLLDEVSRSSGFLSRDWWVESYLSRSGPHDGGEVRESRLR